MRRNNIERIQCLECKHSKKVEATKELICCRPDGNGNVFPVTTKTPASCQKQRLHKGFVLWILKLLGHNLCGEDAKYFEANDE
jgi:hypothetical protein